MGDCVKVLPKDCISGGPCAIYFPQLLYGDGVFTVGVRLLVGAKNLVDLVEEVPEHLAPLPGSSQDNLNEVVQVDIDVGLGSGALIRWEILLAGFSLGLQCAGIVGRSGLSCQIQRVLACLIPLGDVLV